jgi:hypothetical protein
MRKQGLKVSKLANLIRILYDANNAPNPKTKELYIAQQLEREEETQKFLHALCSFIHEHDEEKKVEEVEKEVPAAVTSEEGIVPIEY